jgi:hypothetical protein
MTCNTKRIDDLSGYHPPMYMLEKLKDIYLDRIYPVLTYIHVPTFWSSLLLAYQNPRNIDRPLEALIFSFYFTTISSLRDDECEEVLGESRITLLQRYRLPARQAIFNANIFKTTSPTTLQAFIMYLMGTKGFHHSASLYVLSGIAVRLARRMGLQRDGSHLGFSPFETEMRRRLWWQVVHMDSRLSDFAGVRQSLDLYYFTDTKPPANLNDDDLNPEMTVFPPDRTGLTKAVLTHMKCDIMAAINKFTPASSLEVRWDRLTGNNIRLAEKDKIVQEIKDNLETKYLRFCDVSIPLHHFVTVMARSAITKMTLLAHNPRQWADCGAKVPDKERDLIFENGTKLLQYSDIIYSTPSLRKYMWQVRYVILDMKTIFVAKAHDNSSSHLWDTILYVLIEIRHRKVGLEVEKAWKLIERAHDNYPDIIQETTEALDIALSNWTLQVWDECVAAKKAQGISEGTVPGFIATARMNKKQWLPKTQSNGSSSVLKHKDVMLPETSVMQSFDPMESIDFSNFLSFDLAPNEWAQLDSLFGGTQQ